MIAIKAIWLIIFIRNFSGSIQQTVLFPRMHEGDSFITKPEKNVSLDDFESLLGEPESHTKGDNNKHLRSLTGTNNIYYRSSESRASNNTLVEYYKAYWSIKKSTCDFLPFSPTVYMRCANGGNIKLKTSYSCCSLGGTQSEIKCSGCRDPVDIDFSCDGNSKFPPHADVRMESQKIQCIFNPWGYYSYLRSLGLFVLCGNNTYYPGTCSGSYKLNDVCVQDAQCQGESYCEYNFDPYFSEFAVATGRCKNKGKNPCPTCSESNTVFTNLTCSPGYKPVNSIVRPYFTKDSRCIQGCCARNREDCCELKCPKCQKPQTMFRNVTCPLGYLFDNYTYGTYMTSDYRCIKGCCASNRSDCCKPKCSICKSPAKIIPTSTFTCPVGYIYESSIVKTYLTSDGRCIKGCCSNNVTECCVPDRSLVCKICTKTIFPSRDLIYDCDTGFNETMSEYLQYSNNDCMMGCCADTMNDCCEKRECIPCKFTDTKDGCWYHYKVGGSCSSELCSPTEPIGFELGLCPK